MESGCLECAREIQSQVFEKEFIGIEAVTVEMLAYAVRVEDLVEECGLLWICEEAVLDSRRYSVRWLFPLSLGFYIQLR